jgi:hypothetical protein
MSKFVYPLRVVQLDQERWQLEGPMLYESDLIHDHILVPAGFITDFASVPRIPFAYLLTGNKAQAPAVVHDWLYSTQKFTRDVADDILHEAILASGYSRFTAWIMWAGVRMGGWVAWKKPNLKQPPHIRLPEIFRP